MSERRMFSEEETHAMFLRWRDVEDPCSRCHGTGRIIYGCGATWRGGAGAACIERDVCDACWGSGDRFRSGVNLRQLRDEESKRVAEAAVDALARSCGAGINSTRAEIMKIAEILKKEAGKRGRSIWFQPLAEGLAAILEKAVKG